MMTNIANYTEAEFPYDIWVQKRKGITSHDDIADAISSAACNIAEQIDANAIVTSTMSGYTAQQIARHRPITPIIAVSPREQTKRRLAIVWGVETLEMDEVSSTDEMISRTLEVLQNSIVTEGDSIVLTGGVPFGKSGLTNLIQVHRVS